MSDDIVKELADAIQKLLLVHCKYDEHIELGDCPICAEFRRYDGLVGRARKMTSNG